MVRLGDILTQINAVESRTLRIPTHVLVSKSTLDDLISQYNEVANSDADAVYQFGEQTYMGQDIEEFLGAKIVVSLHHSDDFKVLEEVTTDS